MKRSTDVYEGLVRRLAEIEAFIIWEAHDRTKTQRQYKPYDKARYQILDIRMLLSTLIMEDYPDDLDRVSKVFFADYKVQLDDFVEREKSRELK
jgi:hypothetical protein